MLSTFLIPFVWGPDVVSRNALWEVYLVPMEVMLAVRWTVLSEPKSESVFWQTCGASQFPDSAHSTLTSAS